MKPGLSAKMYYFPKKENSLGRVNNLKSAWDRILGIHCLLLPQHSDICLGKDITYSLFTSSPPKTLDELSHVGSRTPDPVRYISIKKKVISSEVFENGWFSLSSWQIGILKVQRPNQTLQELGHIPIGFVFFPIKSQMGR